MTDEAFKQELREEMRTNRAAAYDLRQVNRTLVVAVNENVGRHALRSATRFAACEPSCGPSSSSKARRRERSLREMREELRGMREDLLGMRDAIRANTAAVLHVLDELRGRGPSDATS